MRPKKGSPYIRIPLTFDMTVKNKTISKKNFFISFALLGTWLVFSIVALIIKFSMTTFFWMLLSFLILLVVIRFGIMQERYFKKQFEELDAVDYKFDYKSFWGIYEISNTYPYICKLSNGAVAAFVRFEKDVIVGKEENNDFLHWEAIADAYKCMSSVGIDCMHIDYMDMVGKDERMGNLLESTKNIKNEDLKKVIVSMYSYVEKVLENTYSSYDVYCFYGYTEDTVFWENLQSVLGCFKHANFVKATVLNSRAIGELTEILFPVHNFSASANSDSLFAYIGGTNYITPIWVERQGERKILNKTSEEKAELQEVAQEEYNMRKNTRKKKDINKDEEVDLFD